VQVVDESNGEIQYTLRIKGREFRPRVFHAGSYTIRVGDQGQRTREFTKVRSVPEGDAAELRVRFD
jgi:hypothetical protein